MASRFSNPSVTPTTILASKDRVRPCRLRLNPSSSGRSTRAVPSSTTIRMLTCMVWVRDPRGPFTVTMLSPPTATSTPPGNAMGCFPILLIVPLVPRPSPHVREYFAADAVARRVFVRHHAMGRADDGDPEPPHDTGQVATAAVDPPTGFRHTPETGDGALLARPVLQTDAEQLVDTFPFAFVPVDEPFVCKDVEHGFRELGRGSYQLILVRSVGVADPRQQIRDRVRDVRRELRLLRRRRRARPGGRCAHHEAFVTPGSSPRCASSRKQIRHRRYRL